MPIILAIEPDRRQAAQVDQVVRQRVGAELILADTTERALDAIGNRIPDMVLVPAFLSPQDDAALAAALRVIAAAAHVRTLTIPLLANGEKRAPSSGILTRWRRSRAGSPTPDGCDPAVFAEQITAYLKETAAERAELETAPDVAAKVETAEILEVQPAVFATPERIEPSVVGPIELVADEPSESLAVSDTTSIEMFAGEPAGIDTLPPAIDEPASVEPALIEEAIVEEPVIDELVVEEPVLEQAVIDVRGVHSVVEATLEAAAEPPRAHIEPWIPMILTPGPLWPALEGVEAEPPPPLDEFLDEPKPQPEPVVAAALARSSAEWTALVASLRQDIERRRGEPAKKQSWQMKKSKPVQDEWGFFDPAQCGFSALLAKLEEITDTADQ